MSILSDKKKEKTATQTNIHQETPTQTNIHTNKNPPRNTRSHPSTFDDVQLGEREMDGMSKGFDLTPQVALWQRCELVKQGRYVLHVHRHQHLLCVRVDTNTSGSSTSEKKKIMIILILIIML